MPNLRARRQPPSVDLRTIIARPLLAFGGITKSATGAILGQASVRGFNRLTDLVVSRDISGANGQYTMSTPTTAVHYAVAIQDATIDSTVITIDNTGVTIDRTRAVAGVSDPAMVGTS